jgi:uracil-DNA glycosylase
MNQQASLDLDQTTQQNNDSSRIKLPPCWKAQLAEEFTKDYMVQLKAFLLAEKQAGKTIYPKASEWFNALNLTPFEQVKVVILGQDPYHGPDQAHGLCFSVQPGVALPPSLQNIFQEIQQDLGIAPSQQGLLTPWAEQGVLLLNSVLTVVRHQAGSHQGRGWETFTDRIIECLNQQRQGLVFLLWGSYAQRKGQFIDAHKHLVLKSPHPSPLSAHRGFFGNRHFSQANAYLVNQGKTPIDWQLS